MNAIVPIEMPEHFTQFQPTINTVAEEARALRITDAVSYKQAGALLMTVKGALKQIEAQRLEITRPANEIIRTRNAEAKQAAQPFLDAEQMLKRGIIAYDDLQRRIAAEAQRKLDDAARREREKLAERAAKAAASGKLEKAAQLEEKAAMVAAPVVQAEAPKVAGVSSRKAWKFEIVDASKVNPLFLMPDTVKIGRQVTALGRDAQDVVGEGVRIYEDTIVSSRSA